MPIVVVACDLDRTLIYSQRALATLGTGHSGSQLVVVEVHRGEPVSFYTGIASQSLARLRAVAEFVPATTRTVAAYRRLSLAGGSTRYAVTSHGGRILVDGHVDEEWSVRTAAEIDRHCAPLPEVLDRLAGSAPRYRWRTADDLFCYLTVEPDSVSTDRVEELSEACSGFGWSVSVHGRRLYCLPRVLSKSSAVTEVTHRLGGGYLIAAGDSLLDVDVLRSADEAFRPMHGELHEAGWVAENLTVIQQGGILGGEELVGALLAAALRET